jgi:hypothetical protein
MRVVTPTLAAAIEAVERVVDATAAVDWDGDGYNTIDTSDPFNRVTSSGINPHPTLGTAYLHTGVGGTVVTTDTIATGSEVTMSVPVAAGFRIAYLRAAVLNVEDTDITVEWSCPAPTGGDLEPGNIYVRCQDQSNYVMGRVVVTPAGVVMVAIFHNQTVPSGNSYVLLDPTVVTGLVFDPAVHWKTRVQVISNRYRIKVWRVDVAQPDDWAATVYDAAVWTSGGWGLRCGVAAGNTNTKPVVFTIHDVTVAFSPEDDISGKLADFSIDRDMRGQLPDEVLVVEGISAATGSGSLTAADTVDEVLDTVRYFSRTNPGSPIYGKPRDSRDFRLAARFVTDAGFETAPRLTGAVVRAIPVNAGNRTASIEVIDGRDRFRLPITLPAVIADGAWDGTAAIPTKPGLEASWIASYVLSRCGYPLSPRPRAECRLFMPMHGSMTPFIQTPYSGAPLAKYEPSTTTSAPERVKFTSGPFFLAADPLAAGAGYISAKAPVNAAPTDLWNSVGRATGIRIEVWVKRTGSEPTVDAAHVGVYNDVLPTQSSVNFWARTAGTLAVLISNGASSFFAVSVPTFSANVWHLVGVHVDDVLGRITWRIDGTSTVVTYAPTTSGTLVTASAVACSMESYAQCSDLHVSACDEATAWLPTAHTSGAVVDRLQNRTMGGLYPDKPIEAWQILQDVTAAEMGTCRIDYDGRPTVWSAARRNSPDSLNVQRTVTARQHLTDVGYDDRRDMIRNLLRVPWVNLTTGGFAPVWSLTELVYIESGDTQTYQVKLENPLAGSIVTLTGTCQRNADGTGGGYGYTDILESGIRANLTLTSPTAATITLTNISPYLLWLVDTGGVPDLIMTGTALKKLDTDPVQVQDDAAIARRGGPGIGEAPLDVDDNPYRQSMQLAYGVAYALLASLRDEQVVFTDITIPGDPRLEDLDRIQVQDPGGLVLDTPVLIEGIGDDFSPGSYDMSLVARPARDQWLLGGPGVGTPLGSTILGGLP